MKRILTVLFILVLTLSLGMSALADVIYEPEDSFYQKHKDECYYENRVYIASGEAGSATVKKNPTSSKTVKELPNGSEIYVSYIWDREGGWALLDGSGWVSLAELTVKYDSISFEEEHRSEFLYLEDWEFLDLTDCDCIQLWRYPGDTEPFYSLSWTGENAWFLEPPEDLSFNTVYEDADGLRWGHIHYYYGFRDCWVCMTDPDAERIPGSEPAQVDVPGPVDTRPTAAPVETNTPAPTAAPATAAPSGEPATPQPTELPPIIDPEPPRAFPWLPAGLAAGALVIAGGLLAIFRKKK